MFLNMRQFWLFCGHLNCCYILINYFLLTNKVGLINAPIIRINYLSENVICSKNDKIVTKIYLKSLGTKIDKKDTLVV